MGKQMFSLGIRSCAVGIKGPDYRTSFARAILFSIIKYAKITIERIDILSKIRFGGTKFSKKANRKGKGKKKKKEKGKKKVKMVLGRVFYKLCGFKNSSSLRCFNSLSGGADSNFTNVGESFSVYSFLLGGDMVKDVVVKEFDACLEVPRRSLVSIFTIFKYHSLTRFEFLVDIVS